MKICSAAKPVCVCLILQIKVSAVHAAVSAQEWTAVYALTATHSPAIEACTCSSGLLGASHLDAEQWPLQNISGKSG